MKIRFYLLLAALSIFSSFSFSQDYLWESSGLPLSANQVFDVYYSEDSGILYVTGLFLEQIDGVNEWYDLARFDGTDWDFDQSFNHQVRNITEYNGSVLITGSFYEHHSQASKIYEVEGNLDLPPVQTEPELTGMNLKVVNDTLFAYGQFDKINGTQVNGLAKWDGTNWIGMYPLTTLEQAPLIADVEYYQGEYYICGGTNFSETYPYRLAVFRDNDLQQVGQGIIGQGGVGELLVYNDELVIAGTFYKENGNPGNMIMKWDGVELKSIGGDLYYSPEYFNSSASVSTIEHIDDKLFIGGAFGYAGDILSERNVIWDGEKFCALGGTTSSIPTAFTKMNDQVVVAGIWDVDGVLMNKLSFYSGSSDICSTVNVFEISQLNTELQVFPNPSNGWFEIQLKGPQLNDTEFYIYSLDGKEIPFDLIDDTPNRYSLDLSNQSVGLYLIRMVSGDQVFTSRIQIE